MNDFCERILHPITFHNEGYQAGYEAAKNDITKIVDLEIYPTITSIYQQGREFSQEMFPNEPSNIRGIIAVSYRAGYLSLINEDKGFTSWIEEIIEIFFETGE
jgi:hypothetical protein